MRVAMSRARIPVAVVCALISLLFVVTLITYGATLFTVGVSSALTSQDGRLAIIYFPLSIVGILSFGFIALGLFARHSRTATIGLALFAMGAIAQIIAIFVPP